MTLSDGRFCRHAPCYPSELRAPLGRTHNASECVRANVSVNVKAEEETSLESLESQETKGGKERA
jgi:hypothetical protein